MCANGSARQCFLVEWYRPDAGASFLDDAIDRVRRAVAAGPVRLLVALAAPSDETLFGVFAADSAEAVLQVCRAAGWHTDRITAGVQARIAGAER